MKTTFPRLKPQLVAIVGPSGAGKSWLAAALRERLGKQAATLSLDDFYLDRSHLSPSRRRLVNFDHPRSIDWDELEGVLRRCRAGLPVRIPRYDFVRHARRGFSDWRSPRPVVLVEGLWLLRRPAFRRLFAFSVFVGCPEWVQLQRRIIRDTTERGRTEGSVREQFVARVAPLARCYVLPQKRWADAVVNSPPSTFVIAELVERIRALAEPRPAWSGGHRKAKAAESR